MVSYIPILQDGQWKGQRDAPFPDSPLDRMFQTLSPVQGRCAHGKLSCETQATAIPLFDDGSLVEALYVLRPIQKE